MKKNKTMNKEQAMLKVADLEKELAQLKEIINKPEPVKSFKRWRGERSYKYYFISDYGVVETSNEIDDSVDNYRYSIGNYFQTEEEAEEYKEKLIFNQSVIDRIAELNEGWTPDWNNHNQNKYRIAYDFRVKDLFFDCNNFNKHTSDNKHFKSKEIGETILKEFDKEKLIKWFI